MVRKSALVLTVAVVLLALVRCEVAFPEQTYKGTVAGGGGGAGGAGTDGAAGNGGSNADGGTCFPSPAQKFCGGMLCPEKTDALHGCAQASCKPCELPNAVATCGSSGKCAVENCDSGFANCNGDATDGCEINTDSDPTNCGTCGHDCFSSGTGSNWVCQSGKCVVSNCATGKGDCNNDPSDGCETNLTSDPQNCSFCQNDCSTTVQHATPSCSNSTCGYSTCDTGWADCDSNKSNGCEQDVATDPSNCGSCNQVCDNTNGLPACQNGSCTIGCNSGYGNCDNAASNGCETNLNTSANHCGSCNTACSTNHDTPTCTGGQCVINCKAGYDNCDGIASNGCEVSLGTDVNHCGSCGNACSTNNGTPTCVGGQCQINCNANWADCNNNPSDGCEASLNDKYTCGNCATACQGGKTCQNGKCQ